MRAIDRFERFGTPLHNGQDHLKNHIFEKYPVVETDNTEDLDQIWNAKFETEYVWLVDKNIQTLDSFPWFFRPTNQQPAIHSFPYVYRKSRKIKSWDCVKLVPTKKAEYETRKHTHICGEYDVYKGKSRFDIFYIGSDQLQIDRLTEKFETVQCVDTIQAAQQNSFTDMFWVVYDDTIIRDTFKFSYEPDEWSFDFVHVFGNGDIDQLDGIALVPKQYDITQRELDHRFFVNKKEIRIMASNPKPYDQFVINNYDDYEFALRTSKTEMFWGIPGDIDILKSDIFDFYISHHSRDRKHNHVWLNGNNYDGVVLFSKHAIVTAKEIEYRFLADRIEHSEIVSQSKSFEHFSIDTYEDYLDAVKYSSTNMFWGIPSDVVPVDGFAWDNHFDETTVLDRDITHVFLNGDSYDGIVLYSTSVEVSEKEIQHRFFLNKKEHNTVASNPKPYDQFVINSYEDYTEALYNSKTEMFWGIPSDVQVDPNFDFGLYFSHHNQYDRNINHIFLNDNHRDGVVLFSKNLLVSEKEVEHRFYIKKKEWDIVASIPKLYDVFEINSYDDYLAARENSTTDMFWLTYPDLNVDFEFDLYIDHHNQYERKINHVWKNGEYYDGVALTNKHVTLAQREINYRFFAVKKEYDVIASTPKPYDVVFISNNESNADANYAKLLEKAPHAKRVHGVKGIHQAHIAAAKLCNTEMFWVVDGDADVLDDFDFDYQIAHYDLDGKQTVHVWRSFNPVNNLVYGYGGVKLLPTELTLNVDVNSADMTTSISKHFKGIDRMSNTTAFNTDEFSAWRSGFRECVKLASRVIDRQKDDETEFRLDAWCSRGEDKPFGKFAISGAKAGREYGEKNKNNLSALKRINDFEWLHEQFTQSYQPVE